MADSKKIAKQILHGIGKGFYYFGKGLYLLGRAIGRDIQREYQRGQERKRIEEEQRRYYRGIERENYHAGRGYARGMSDVQEENRVRRQNERYQREASSRFERQMFDVPKVNEKMFEVPKVNEDFWNQDLYPKKRKKRQVSYF